MNIENTVKRLKIIALHENIEVEDEVLDIVDLDYHSLVFISYVCK